MKNNLLQLRGEFIQEKRQGSYGKPKLKGQVSVDHLRKLKLDLEVLHKFWSKESLISGALIDVGYSKIVPKSSRISGFLSYKNIESSDSIVGARFSEEERKKHIFTHYVSLDTLYQSIQWLNVCIEILNNMFNGNISSTDIESINNKEKVLHDPRIKDDLFVKLICDAYIVEYFGQPNFDQTFTNQAIISLYDTNMKVDGLLAKIGIRLTSHSILNNTTILLNENELKILKERAPYLIAMGADDEKTFDDVKRVDKVESNKFLSIPKPNNEPVIGVIDKVFDTNVYFTDWVEPIDLVDETLRDVEKDDFHGTEVTSIIVDGPSLNPKLDDGCGRFRVRHFAVAAGKKFSSFNLLKNIQRIITENKDIKVWNISLGSILETNSNYVSPEAAILDQIQYENDVIFVIAGTNDPNHSTIKRIGSPADSINSLVVNSVNMKKQPASYARIGPVLSFFHKPDVSYYGGDNDSYLHVCTPLGERLVSGTSFAAPWIARKLAYLIHVLKFSREVAKALIIDSAADWKNNIFDKRIGYGVVPIKIQDIVESENNEIKFFFYTKSEKYNTYTYNIPVPLDENDKFPFIAKATLCYYPACSRNQGVDYTNTEFDISFGRMRHGKIKTINNNIQNEISEGYVFEEEAREYYRKWDNVKHIQEKIKPNTRARDSYETSLWGLSIRTKERLKEKYGEGMNFGVVVTLKEIKGRNRIEEFIRQCVSRGWLVSRVEIENRIEIYNKAEEDIVFED